MMSTLPKILITLSALSFVSPTFAMKSATYNDSVRLYNDVIQQHGHHIRPLANQSSPILVHVTVYILGLLDIDEIRQRMDYNVLLNLTWVDEIRTWDPEDYGGINLLHVEPLSLWRPRVLVANSVSDRDVFEDNYSTLSLQSDGVTKWFPSAVFSISCIFDLTYFPFDQQTCQTRVVSNEYIASVNFRATFPKVIKATFIPHGEWELVSDSVEVDNIYLAEETAPRFNINLTFKRRPSFFVANFLIPVICLSALSSLVFALPEKSGERASFSITVLLSLAVFMSIVSAQLPQNSQHFPIICEYLLALMVVTGASVFVTVLHLGWYHRNMEVSSGNTSSGLSSSFSNQNQGQSKNSFLNAEPLSAQSWGAENNDSSYRWHIPRVRLKNSGSDCPDSQSDSRSNGPTGIYGSATRNSSLAGIESQAIPHSSTADDENILSRFRRANEITFDVPGTRGWLRENLNSVLFSTFFMVWMSTTIYYMLRLAE